MQSVQRLIKTDLDAVDRIIQDNLTSNVTLIEHIGDYLVSAGGKRLRPMLSLIVGHSVGADMKKVHDLSAAIEFIHTATLLHDDVVDESELRRGRATANAEFGNAPSVLVGDFIYSRAFQLMVKLRHFDVIEILSQTTNILAEGEVMQLINAGNPDLSERDYYDVIRAKTAKLFEAACVSAAYLKNEVSPATIKAFSVFGDQLGISFQLVDDLLDYIGDTDRMGKNIGDDLAEGKTTLPLIHAMQHASQEQAQIIKTALINKDASAIEHVISIVKLTGSLDYTRAAAITAANNAKNSIQDLDASVFKQALIDICDYCVARTL